jgi:hypothetical protein
VRYLSVTTVLPDGGRQEDFHHPLA